MQQRSLNGYDFVRLDNAVTVVIVLTGPTGSLLQNTNERGSVENLLARGRDSGRECATYVRKNRCFERRSEDEPDDERLRLTRPEREGTCGLIESSVAR